MDKGDTLPFRFIIEDEYVSACLKTVTDAPIYYFIFIILDSNAKIVLLIYIPHRSMYQIKVSYDVLWKL